MAAAGAMAGLAGAWIAHARHPDVVWDLDRDLPAVTRGFHPVERDGERTFAWTAASATFRLDGARRGGAWTCTVRLRGARPADRPQPLVQIGADGMAEAALTATNDYQDVTVTVPARPGRAGLALTITGDPVMVPGPHDPRPLGVQVDRIACAPDRSGLAVAPWRALAAAAASAGLFGAGAVTAGAGLGVALALTAGLALAQALPLTGSVGPYSAYPVTVAWLALAVALLMTIAAAIARWRGRVLHPIAAGALAFVCAAALLELYGLLHPAKPIVDALFQAHRLEWVLDRRWFFTQPMPDGVRFPYAIALYVVAAPWTLFTSDYVSLLRIVVVAARAVAAIAMYPMVRRAGGERITAALTTAMVYLVPLPYLNIGNANLTFVFGQAASMCALAAAVAWRVERRVMAAIGLFALCALAFLSHVGVFPVLLAALVLFAALLWWVEAGRRRAAVVLLAVAVGAAAFSVAVYYGRFSEAYQSLDRVKARAASIVGTTAAGDGRAAPEAAARSEGPSLAGRAVSAVLRIARATGWPLVALAAVGAWRGWRDRARDRAWLAAVAITAATLVFLASAVAAPVEPRFQRYTDEFIDRLGYLALPAAVVLAARGAAWLMRTDWSTALVSWALLVAAGWGAAEAWMAWLQ